MEYNERIRQHIKSNGIYLKHVAEKSGIDYKRFYRMMNSKMEISVSEYERICEALNVRLDFFQKSFLESKNKTA